MARYPTFEEYQKRGNYKDGIKRCDDLLKKNPNDVQLLTVKLQLFYAANRDAEPILQQLVSIQPPILDLRDIILIEEAVVNGHSDDFPQPRTCGPAVLKLWDNAFKASTSVKNKIDLLSLRYSEAMRDNRLVDAQQALIQLKALTPKNRVVYMAHAAVTQLLSTSNEDLQSRLALSLARKAVTENFDHDKSLDCRVPGQIFAMQSSTKDLESIAKRPFKESKQVYETLRDRKATEVNGVLTPPASQDAESIPPSEWLRAEVQTLKQKFSMLVDSSAQVYEMLSFCMSSIHLFHTATTLVSDGQSRGLADACFLSVSTLVRLFEMTSELRHLLQAAFLAETLLKQNTHIHEARLILVYLYMRLGLVSLALRLFDSLNVKEIQHDTVGHALFTKIAVTHPHDAKLNKRDSIDPCKRTAHALKVYTRHEERLAETESNVLSHGQTGMIFDLRELRDSLRSSLTRRITYLEHRRTNRLIHGSSEEGVAQLGPRVAANWLKPEWTPALVGLGLIFEEKGEYENAINFLSPSTR